MENMMLKKQNGKLEIKFIDVEILNEMTKKECHLCANCENCRANKCQKVADIDNKYIGKYDFISDGYQVYNGNGKISDFIVRECGNYEKEQERRKPQTKEELLNQNRLKASLKINYFNAESLEEANRIQNEMFYRGSLVEFDPNTIALRK